MGLPPPHPLPPNLVGLHLWSYLWHLREDRQKTKVKARCDDAYYVSVIYLVLVSIFFFFSVWMVIIDKNLFSLKGHRRISPTRNVLQFTIHVLQFMGLPPPHPLPPNLVGLHLWSYLWHLREDRQKTKVKARCDDAYYVSVIYLVLVSIFFFFSVWMVIIDKNLFSLKGHRRRSQGIGEIRGLERCRSTATDVNSS